MATRDSKLERGRRQGRALARRLVNELSVNRRTSGISQQRLATAMGVSQSRLSRLERLVVIDDVSIVRIAEMAGLLGLELNAGVASDW